MSMKEASTTDRPTSFVGATIKRCNEDKALAAQLRRADNPATEYQSWEWLARWHINLEKPWERLPWATIAAAIARAKPAANGTLRLGAAVAACFQDGAKDDQGKARLRRLLACTDTPEACRILRPTLKLIESRVPQVLDYARLLRQLQRFHFHADFIRAEWAQEFYRRATTEETES